MSGQKQAGVKELGADKLTRNTARFDQNAPVLRKPPWIRVRLPPGNAVAELKSRLRENHLVTVCEEASCPNIHECWQEKTAKLGGDGDTSQHEGKTS